MLEIYRGEQHIGNVLSLYKYSKNPSTLKKVTVYCQNIANRTLWIRFKLDPENITDKHIEVNGGILLFFISNSGVNEFFIDNYVVKTVF